jgi:hypothetical protein
VEGGQWIGASQNYHLGVNNQPVITPYGSGGILSTSAAHQWDVRGSRAFGLTGIAYYLESGHMRLEYALNGDADLDGDVDSSDLGVLTSHWQGSGYDWSGADFAKYDGEVDIWDEWLLDNGWGMTWGNLPTG